VTGHGHYNPLPHLPRLPSGPNPAAPAVGGWIHRIFRDATGYAKAVGAASGFSLIMLPFIILFLLIQRRLDKDDPKLALAPVHSQPDLPFVDPFEKGEE
jgi:hypothetical protein